MGDIERLKKHKSVYRALQKLKKKTLTQTSGQFPTPIAGYLALYPRRSDKFISPSATEDGSAAETVIVLLQLEMGLL